MLRRTLGLFRRYLGHHLCLTRSGPLLEGPGLRAETMLALTSSHLRVTVIASKIPSEAEFWVLDENGFRHRLMSEALVPHGAPQLTVLMARRPGQWRLEEAHSGVAVLLPVPGLWAERIAVLRLLPRFLLRSLRAAPLIARWIKTRDPSLRAAIGSTLGMNADRRGHEIDPRYFVAPQLAGPVQPAPGVVILLPVYNSFELLAEVIDRVEAHTDLPWHLIAIEDCSSDARVRPWLRDRIAFLGHRATLLENPQNLGFIGSVNRGFASAAQFGWPVVLLNSDAFVPKNWASRLVAPLMANVQVASTTPMSNDAELMTVPVICAPHDLALGQGDALDEVASRFDLLAEGVEVPTGVGFCMALSHHWLAKVPQFDTIFGRGYGEEVDWCQRVSALGGRHLGLPGLFVEHRGGASFGSAEKQALIASNNLIVESRYPRFPLDVRAFLAEDPLSTPRLALALAFAGLQARGRLPVFVAHVMGGGADIWLQNRMAETLAADGAGAAIVLRLGGSRRWQLELHLPSQPVQIGETDDCDLIARLLAPLPPLHLVYSCAVGDKDPVAIPDLLLGLLRGGDTAEILFHDFYPLSPAYTLLNSDARFQGVPAVDATDPAHQARRPDGRTVSLAEWRSAWERLAVRAEWLTVFSQDSKRHVAEAWPALADKIRCVPHVLHTPVPRIDAPAPDAPLAIAVLGNIGLQKGITLVAALGKRLAEIPGAPRLVVIGNTDPAYVLAPSIKVHGAYALMDLPLLAGQYGVCAWLIPSIWPETFSFTTHEALATGLPVLGLNIGAQGDALNAHPNGHTVPLEETEAMAGKLSDLILVLAAKLRH